MSFLAMYPDIKVSESETHVFFLNGPFSQWWPSQFRAPIFLGDEYITVEFHCGEQYMMAGKALTFGDLGTFEKIMEVEQTGDWRDAPRKIKNLGREVKNFDQSVWDAHCEAIVYDGNMSKFSQNVALRDFLFAFGNKHFVEGADYDRVWGVGLRWNDPQIIDVENWQGTNKLGLALDRVRTMLSRVAVEHARVIAKDITS